jgi:myo-inositol catabolism protein IolC
MKLETNDSSLNASQLVNKHRASTHRYGCQQICLLMDEHRITIEDLAVHLGEPSKAERLAELKSKLFAPVVEEETLEQETEEDVAEELRPAGGDDTIQTNTSEVPNKTNRSRKTIPAKGK